MPETHLPSQVNSWFSIMLIIFEITQRSSIMLCLFWDVHQHTIMIWISFSSNRDALKCLGFQSFPDRYHVIQQIKRQHKKSSFAMCSIFGLNELFQYFYISRHIYYFLTAYLFITKSLISFSTSSKYFVSPKGICASHTNLIVWAINAALNWTIIFTHG